MNEAMTDHLAVRGLRLSRGGFPLFAGLDLTVAAGEIVVLTGANGAGKTSLLRALAGLIPLDGGEVLSCGQGPVEARSLMVFLGHLDGVKPNMSVRENLCFWCDIHSTPPEAGITAAAALGISDLLDRAAGTLSAGQRRRLGFCRVPLSRRPFWLLDEPTASLDAASIDRMCTIIRAHVAGEPARGAVRGAVLIATHDALPLPGARNLRLAPGAPAVGCPAA